MMMMVVVNEMFLVSVFVGLVIGMICWFLDDGYIYVYVDV